MKSTVNEIERKIKRNRRGKFYFAADFATSAAQNHLTMPLNT